MRNTSSSIPAILAVAVMLAVSGCAATAPETGTGTVTQADIAELKQQISEMKQQIADLRSELAAVSQQARNAAARAEAAARKAEDAAAKADRIYTKSLQK